MANSSLVFPENDWPSSKRKVILQRKPVEEEMVRDGRDSVEWERGDLPSKENRREQDAPLFAVRDRDMHQV